MALTPRQTEVLLLYATGYRRAKIAELLCIEEKTVEHHLEHIHGRLGSKSLANAIHIGHCRGIIESVEHAA